MSGANDTIVALQKRRVAVLTRLDELEAEAAPLRREADRLRDYMAGAVAFMRLTEEEAAKAARAKEDSEHDTPDA